MTWKFWFCSSRFGSNIHIISNIHIRYCYLDFVLYAPFRKIKIHWLHQGRRNKGPENSEGFLGYPGCRKGLPWGHQGKQGVNSPTVEKALPTTNVYYISSASSYFFAFFIGNIETKFFISNSIPFKSSPSDTSTSQSKIKSPNSI